MERKPKAPTEIAEFIRLKRKEKGYATASAFIKATGINKNLYSKIEWDDKLPRFIDAYLIIAKTLDVSLEDIFFKHE